MTDVYVLLLHLLRVLHAETIKYALLSSFVNIEMYGTRTNAGLPGSVSSAVHAQSFFSNNFMQYGCPTKALVMDSLSPDPHCSSSETYKGIGKSFKIHYWNS